MISGLCDKCCTLFFDFEDSNDENAELVNICENVSLKLKEHLENLRWHEQRARRAGIACSTSSPSSSFDYEDAMDDLSIHGSDDKHRRRGGSSIKGGGNSSSNRNRSKSRTGSHKSSRKHKRCASGTDESQQRVKVQARTISFDTALNQGPSSLSTATPPTSPPRHQQIFNRDGGGAIASSSNKSDGSRKGRNKRS